MSLTKKNNNNNIDIVDESNKLMMMMMMIMMIVIMIISCYKNHVVPGIYLYYLKLLYFLQLCYPP